MINHSYKIKAFIGVVTLAFNFSSCEYKDVRDAEYATQKIYMPTAANAINGLYTIDQVAVPGQDYMYTVDLAQKKLNIPLGVLRSGVTADGVVNVSIASKTDTLIKLIAADKLPMATNSILPDNKFTFTPSVNIASGQDLALFNVAVDLDYLLDNPTKRYAIAITISSPNVEVNTKLNTTVIVIDPKMLIPDAAFDHSVISVANKTVKFTNKSKYGVSYFWEFGDGQTSTLKSPEHAYNKTGPAGPFTVKLTTTGAVGTYRTPPVATKTFTIN